MREYKYHIPVMIREVLHSLACHPGGVYIDGTLGMGGHASAILEESDPDGMLIGIEWDEESLGIARETLAPFGNRVTFVHDTFEHMKGIMQSLGLEGVDGILLDLGISSYQIERSDRGFSFKGEQTLDMRMDTRGRLTARDIVNRFPAKEMERIIGEYGEERWARRIAKAIVRAREKQPIETTAELASIIISVIPHKPHFARIHPATRTFQALRIAVNRELEYLAAAITDAVSLLKPGGRICVISFHSLEDRIVKHCFRNLEKTGPDAGKAMLFQLTRKPVRPSSEECVSNPRARSARLRAAERLAA
ncbi:MAG: 16S rRNA (cytosine(1402)-N(4))-methyltransferase RsmH [Pseudomonadota bacterium]